MTGRNYRTIIPVMDTMELLPDGQRLKELRKVLGLNRGKPMTQRELAEEFFGVTSDTLRKWESGSVKMGPSARKILETMRRDTGLNT